MNEGLFLRSNVQANARLKDGVYFVISGTAEKLSIRTCPTPKVHQ
jgi:hypothetical protein